MKESNETLDFYEQQARYYPVLRARPIQKYTDRLEREFILPWLRDADSALDLGCGEGRLARWMAQEIEPAGGRVQGLDFSAGMIEVARRLDPDRASTYAVGDAMAMPMADDSFSLVVSSTAPNNFPDLGKALSEVHRVLRPGGVFCGIVINSEEAARFSRYAYYAPWYLWQGAKRVLRGPGEYQRHLYSRADLEKLLSGRFEILALEGLRYLADFVPEYPLNFWPPLFPMMEGFLRRTEAWDRRLSAHPRHGRHARFHAVVARAVK